MHRMKKHIRRVAAVLLAAALIAGCRWYFRREPEAVQTGSWGLSFPEEGSTPVGNATPEELAKYDAAFVGVPVRARGATFQQYVQNLKVWSNVADVQTGDRGRGFIEFWPNTYGPGNNKNVTGASGSNYDFGDQMTSGNYGCM